MTKRLAIIGGGPAGLLIFKRLVESGTTHLKIDIFEATDMLGSGMPYSTKGASVEHVTNVSSDELPDLIEPLADWVKALPDVLLAKYNLAREDVHEKKVMPRLLFGQYLNAQFQSLIERARAIGLETEVHYRSPVKDVRDNKEQNSVTVTTSDGKSFSFDHAVVCTGHHWPGENEGKIPGYFDSPYPPAKLAQRFNNTVQVRGSSLTAVDAIRTMARSNGRFERTESGLTFHPDPQSPEFRIVMHSRHGLLPCVRVHMEEPHAAGAPLIEQSSIDENIRANDGFLELDFLFQKGFRDPLKESDPLFYSQIKDMSIEEFVDNMMSYREAVEPFALFKEEFEGAKISIKEERPVPWKEMLSALSFAMNYPAKYLSAEDMLRLRRHLMPLIAVVIAFVPQSSCEELMALHDAGRLDLVADGDDGEVEVTDDGKIIYSWNQDGEREEQVECQTFVDCTGQRHLSVDAFPFRSLVEDGTVSTAWLKFRSAENAQRLIKAGEKHIEGKNGTWHLKVSGADITDNFQVVDRTGQPSERVYLMAVPYMGGYNPDYSGLDFCERASELIVGRILNLQRATPST